MAGLKSRRSVVHDKQLIGNDEAGEETNGRDERPDDLARAVLGRPPAITKRDPEEKRHGELDQNDTHEEKCGEAARQSVRRDGLGDQCAIAGGEGPAWGSDAQGLESVDQIRRSDEREIEAPEEEEQPAENSSRFHLEVVQTTSDVRIQTSEFEC